ncbi:hypothetical protein GUJ93_ZPchr0011g28295 [Zizania palustris]|uniref:Uncharacterized protein n=1 Tax=Zizania palustris TaxID=103762 RepID=A0A8J6BMM2_ZIZPA|nr:hypothetical protein GUJ93_ZPchr0011g28295 [Zizania palustris]
MPLRVLELPSPMPQPPLLQPPAAEPRPKGLQNSWFSPLKLLGCSGGRMEARAQRAQRVFVCKKAVESIKADNGFEGFQMSIFEDVLSQARKSSSRKKSRCCGNSNDGGGGDEEGKRRRKKAASGGKDRAEIAIERAERCLARIRAFKASLLGLGFT